tara:strand:+ start:789 stop:1211 length:423 start_codon:yes stop_codon:yes gene_type:complete
MNEEEIESNNFIQKIFNESPKCQNSIRIEFSNYMNVKELFEFLISFITSGSKILFSNNIGKVNIDSWTDTEYNMLNKYCNSIGFNFILDKYNIDDIDIIDFNKMSYKKLLITNNTKLKLLKLPIKCLNNVFVFSFNFLNN